MALINPKQISGEYYSITGSFTGSFIGDGSGLTGISGSGGSGFPFTGSASISGSLNVDGITTSTYFIGDGSGLTNIPGTGGGVAQLLITTTSSFNTSDLIGGISQNGKHVVVDNGISNITITVDNAVNSFYQKQGTGTITFVSGSGRTLTAPAGQVITTQYNGASLSFNGSENILVLGNAGFFFDESPEVRIGDYRIAEQILDPRFPQLTPLNSSSGEYLIVNTSNYIARTQDTWFDLALDTSNLPGTITDYTFYTKRIVPGYSDLAIGLQFTSSNNYSYIQTNTRYPLSNGVVPSSKTMAVEITAKSGSQYVDSVVYKFQVEPTSSLISGSTIPLIIDADQPSPSSSLVFGVPFSPGQLWDENRVTLQYVGGSPVEYQRETTGNWITSGSIQWLQLRTVAPSSSQLEVVIDGANQPLTGSNLITDLGGGQYEMTAGDYTLVLAKEHSPIKSVKKGSTVIADNTNAKGLYLYVSNTALTASGQLAQSSNDVDITIESAGPVSSCVKIEGDYITSGGTRVAKHITRLESHKGIDGVNISHTLVLSNSTNNIWFSEMGWEFSTNPTTATSVTALFNVTSSDLENVTQIPLNSLFTASILQNSYPTFGQSGAVPPTQPNFSISTNGIISASYISGSMGEWFGYESDNNGLVWGIQDAARQAPKEIVVTRDKINLMLFSPNGGDEIDFRNSTLYDRWNLDNILPYQGTTSASFAATPSDAYGWSKTTNLLLLPIDVTSNISSIAAEANKLRYPDYGYVDANWMYQSEAMGHLYPYDSASFNLAEKFLDGTISLYTGSVPGNGLYNTFFDYYNGPAYFYDQRYRLSYTLIHDSWLLTARNANRNESIRRQTRKFSENTSRAFRDSYICHLDEPIGTPNRKLKGSFLEANGPAGDFPMYWESNSVYNLATSGDILNFIWDYQISGDRRSKDVALSYGVNFKNNFKYNTKLFRTLPNSKHIAHSYQLSGDYEMLLAIEKLKNSYNTTSSLSSPLGPLFYDVDGSLLLSKLRAYGSSTYKTNTDVGSLIETWKVTGSDVFKQMSLRLADYWRNSKMGRSPLVRIYGQYDTFLHYNSGLLSEGQIIDFSFRGKNIRYNPTTGITTNAGFSTFDTLLGGMPYQMDVISKTSASSQPVSSFAAFRSYQNDNPIFIKKGNNGPGIVTYFQPSSATEEGTDEVDDNEITENTTQGGFTFKILKNPITTETWSGNDPIPVTQDGVNPGTAIKLEIAKDLGGGGGVALSYNFVYKFQPTIKENQFLVTDSTASIVFRNDGYWMPHTLKPNYKYYFNVTSSTSSPTIFFEYKTNLYDPTGSLYTGIAVSKSVALPSTGLWSFQPLEYPSLVSSSGMPPYFAINSGSFWFDPLTTITASTTSSVYNDIKVQPLSYPNLGSTTGALISGSIAGGGTGTLKIASSSLDTELFSNVSGTLEFYFKPDNWDSFTMPSTTDISIDYDPTPVLLYRKWMMQIVTAKTPSLPPIQGNVTGNNSWAINYYLLPSGSKGNTNYPSWDPTHAFQHVTTYYNQTGSGTTGTTNAVWAQQELIFQNEWLHMAITWDENNAPVFFVNGRKTSGVDVASNYYAPKNPWYINFPFYLKGRITNLRVSSDVVYTNEFTPPEGENPYGFVSGSTVFYMPLSSSGDFSYIASGSKIINIGYY
jgi:hypothetical protein